MSRIKVLCVVGARPNFVKIAPIMRAAASRPGLDFVLVHTGQHYGADMSQSFFDDLGVPAPAINLEVGSGSHGKQTGDIMVAFEPVVLAEKPDAVLVVGDVNSTLACALVAAKLHVPVIHVEAGLRSGDRAMPEEINRVLTDQLSDLLFTTEAKAADNLTREGVDAANIFHVGNVMIDTLHHSLSRAVAAQTTLAEEFPDADAQRLGNGFALMTLHRPSNVDDPKILRGLLGAVGEIARTLPVIFPMHPRTANAMRAAGLEAGEGLYLLPPQPYLRLLGLLQAAKLVMTDSGGLQEESTALGVPCLTLRENTERWVTVEEGSNTIIGNSPDALRRAFADFQAGKGKPSRIPALWDGKAAERIVEVIERRFSPATPTAAGG
ncbi:MAG TPA: UDP-N-acetylglucosamine 2-epimerase (non-hydrolyzing) [Magnetospirillum sp.]|nr:UDP-N-acetylglucosamine 2-epimerase (non-hydrolyzing) [Magnetospirillum sp.]